MTTDIPENWPGIVIVVLTTLAWFMRLENRLTNKPDREIFDRTRAEDLKEMDLMREKERDRIDALFKDIFALLERRDVESTKFRDEIREGLHSINLQLARLQRNGPSNEMRS